MTPSQPWRHLQEKCIYYTKHRNTVVITGRFDSNISNIWSFFVRYVDVRYYYYSCEVLLDVLFILVRIDWTPSRRTLMNFILCKMFFMVKLVPCFLISRPPAYPQTQTNPHLWILICAFMIVVLKTPSTRCVHTHECLLAETEGINETCCSFMCWWFSIVSWAARTV